MKIFNYLLWIIIIVLGVSFAALNAQLVHFNYYTNEITLPLSLLLAFAFAAGGILGLLTSVGLIIRCKTQVSSLKRQLRKLEIRHLQSPHD